MRNYGVTTTPKATHTMSEDIRHCGMGSKKRVRGGPLGMQPASCQQHCATKVASSTAAAMAMTPHPGHHGQTVRRFKILG